MLSEFRDYLTTLEVADTITIGKIDHSKERALGVFGSTAGRIVESIGRHSSYSTASLRLLLHWTKNARETEEAARALYDKLIGTTHIDMGDVHIQFIDIPQAEPVFVGTDDVGVYEYVIPLTLYYRRTK